MSALGQKRTSTASVPLAYVAYVVPALRRLQGVADVRSRFLLGWRTRVVPCGLCPERRRRYANLVKEAHEKICPYSHATCNNVDVKFEVIGA